MSPAAEESATGGRLTGAARGSSQRAPAANRPLKQRRIGPWRRTFQWLTSLALLLIPFARLGGESLLRVDLATRTLHAFGSSLRVEELYLFLLLVIVTVLILLLLTLVFGRVWCGWACPQTTLSDLVEAFARRIGVRHRRGELSPRSWQVAALHGFCLALGGLVSCNLLWYFVSPYEFFPRLFAADLPHTAVVTLVLVAAVVYFDLAFVRRSLCRTVCPYGRIQTALVDRGTLTLRYPPGDERCIRCEACVRACPTGIDIRDGYQVECINCGRCLDACRGIMAGRGEPGIIAYSFGAEGRSPRALLNPRTGIILIATIAVVTAFVLVASGRSSLGFSVRRASAASRTLPSGETAVFFTGYAANRSSSQITVELTARTPEGRDVALRGAVRTIQLAAGERRKLDFAVVLPKSAARVSGPVIFYLAVPGEEPMVEVRATVDVAGAGGPDG